MHSDSGFESLLNSSGFVEVDKTLIEDNLDQPAQANLLLQLSTNGVASNEGVQNISYLEDRQEHLDGRSEPLKVVRDVFNQTTCNSDQTLTWQKREIEVVFGAFSHLSPNQQPT